MVRQATLRVLTLFLIAINANASISLAATKIDSVAEAYAGQALRCLNRGQIWQATRLYRDAIEAEVKDENDDLYRATLQNNLGECYRRLAFDERQRALSYRMDENKTGPLSKEECIQNAQTELEEALQTKEAKAGTSTDFLYIAKSLENLAMVHMCKDPPMSTDAEALYRKALAIREDKEGKDSANAASDFLGIGNTLIADNQFSEAIQNYKHALAIYTKTTPANDPLQGVCHQKLAIAYFLWNKYPTAGIHYDKAMAIFRRNLPSTQPNLTQLTTKDLPDFPMLSFTCAEDALRQYVQKPKQDPAVYKGLIKDAIAACYRVGKADHAKYLEAALKAPSLAKKG